MSLWYFCQGMIPQTAVKELQACREWDQKGRPVPLTGSVPAIWSAGHLCGCGSSFLHQVDQKMYEMKAAARKTHSE